jgi:hypothetical protein
MISHYEAKLMVKKVNSAPFVEWRGTVRLAARFR